MNRLVEVWVGPQASGKTYQLRRRYDALVQRTRIRSVHVIAPPGEWHDKFHIALRPGERDWMSPPGSDPGQTEQGVLWDVPLEDHGALDCVLRDIVAVGDCVVILDEAWAWAPAGATWRGSPRLKDVLVRGRHLERFDGELRPTHLILATQYPRTLHHLVREQAATVMVSRLQGELGDRWVRQYAGETAQRRMRRLGKHQFAAIVGRDPRRG